MPHQTATHTPDTLSKTLAVQKPRRATAEGACGQGARFPTSYPDYPVQAWGIGDQVLLVSLGGRSCHRLLAAIEKGHHHQPHPLGDGLRERRDVVHSECPRAEGRRLRGPIRRKSTMACRASGVRLSRTRSSQKAKELAAAVARLPEAAGAAHPEGGKGILQARRAVQDRACRQRTGCRGPGGDVLRRKGSDVRLRDARLPERRCEARARRLAERSSASSTRTATAFSRRSPPSPRVCGSRWALRPTRAG